MTITLHNTTAAPIEIADLGVTVHTDGDRDLSGRSPEAISNSADLKALVQAGSITVLRSDGSAYSVADALVALNTNGITKETVGLGNVANIQNNLSGTALPGRFNDTSQGYAQGSLWVFGQRVYSCTNATAGSAQWYELTQPAYHPGIVLERFYSTELDAATVNGTLTTDILYAIPLNFPAGVTLNRIGIEVINPAAGAAIRLGIYSNQNGQPGYLRQDCGSVNATTAGLKEITINYTTENDWWWLACIMSASLGVRCMNSPTGGGSIMGRTSTADSGTRRLQANWGYGPLPFAFPSPAAYSPNNPPFIWVRKV